MKEAFRVSKSRIIQAKKSKTYENSPDWYANRGHWSQRGLAAQKSSTIVEVLLFANQKGRFKTMQSIIKVGQRFKFTVLTDDAPSERQGVVVRVLSNREKGLGLDVEEYMSYWIEARELPETESSTILVFVRSTDGKVYLDGKLTDVTVLP